MSFITERYAGSINSSNLKSEPKTTYSDTDTLGAFGFAAHYVPLGVALQRLFVDGKVEQCVGIMSALVRNRSYKVKERLSQHQADEMAKKVLAWFRFGTCSECGGTGKEVILEPRPHLSDIDCATCSGTGRRPFEPSFKHEQRALALWLKSEVEREQAIAGRQAMMAIAPMLDI